MASSWQHRDVDDPRTVAWARVGIRWRSTGDGEWPYRATVGGHDLAVRVNDFPAEPMYTLFVGEVAITDLEDWPSVWTRP
jgi:hypothetical protein